MRRGKVKSRIEFPGAIWYTTYMKQRVWKKNLALLGAMILLVCVAARAIPVRAAQESVVDTYGLFSEDEIRELAEACDAFHEKTGINTAILSVDGAVVGGYDDQDTVRFMEAYGEENLGANYIALIVNMDIRYYYIDVMGDEAFAVYTDRRQEELGDTVVAGLASGAYADAARGFLRQAEEQYNYAHSTGSFGTVKPAEEAPGGFRGGILGISGLISAAAAGIMTRVRAGSHTEKRLATDADRYIVPGTVNMQVNRDNFVSQYVTRMPVVKDPPDSGGGVTTTHTSLGGHMHSGHGGRF